MSSMKRFFTMFVFAVAMAATGKEPESTPPKQQLPAVTITEKEFGLFDEKKPGKVLFTPTKTVPFVIDQGYGWRLKVDTARKSVLVKHELKLPAPARDWGTIEPGMKVSADRKSCTYTEDCALHRGYIFHAWSVADDDPEGEYAVRVVIDDELIATFKFTVKRVKS